MNTKTQKTLILFNLIVSTVLFLDLCLPGREQKIQELTSFYSVQKSISVKGGYEIRSFVELKNGQIYRIGKLPLEDFNEGQKIKIIESPIFGKVNEIHILDSKWKKIVVSFIPKEIIVGSLIFSIVLTFVSYRFKNSKLDLVLVISTLFIFFNSVIYLVSS